MSDPDITLRLHVWLERDQGMIIGIGRARLLAEIDRQGSLNKAAKVMGMSYRAAWGRLKTSEEMIGQPLVEKGEGSQGFSLSPLGRELVVKFEQLQKDVESYALCQARELFSWDIKPFQSRRK